MTRLMFVLTLVLLMLTAALAGCAKEEPAVTVTPAPTTNITGALEGENPPAGAEAGVEAILTVVNPIGYQIFPVNPVPELTFGGKACTLEDLENYQASGLPYNCAIVYDNEMGALGVYVSGP